VPPASSRPGTASSKPLLPAWQSGAGASTRNGGGASGLTADGGAAAEAERRRVQSERDQEAGKKKEEEARAAAERQARAEAKMRAMAAEEAGKTRWWFHGREFSYWLSVCKLLVSCEQKVPMWRRTEEVEVGLRGSFRGCLGQHDAGCAFRGVSTVINGAGVGSLWRRDLGLVLTRRVGMFNRVEIWAWAFCGCTWSPVLTAHARNTFMRFVLSLDPSVGSASDDRPVSLWQQLQEYFDHHLGYGCEIG
jgi:hypothetical protein